MSGNDSGEFYKELCAWAKKYDLFKPKAIAIAPAFPIPEPFIKNLPPKQQDYVDELYDTWMQEFE